MSHGYNPAGNVSGGQWQAAYQQQGQAAQSAQPQGSQHYVAPQSAPASGYQGAGGYPQGGPQQYAQPQGNPQQYAGQQYPPPQSGQQYGGAQHAQPQQYAQPQQQGQQFVQSGQGGAPQVASQQYAGAQYAQPQQYAAPQSAPSQQASAQLAKDPRADDWVRLKGRANVAILNSALRFFGFPFLSLLIGFARAHDVYDAAKQLGAPSDVLLRARIAMGTAAFFFFLQIAILVVVVIGANM